MPTHITKTAFGNAAPAVQPPAPPVDTTRFLTNESFQIQDMRYNITQAVASAADAAQSKFRVDARPNGDRERAVQMGNMERREQQGMLYAEPGQTKKFFYGHRVGFNYSQNTPEPSNVIYAGQYPPIPPVPDYFYHKKLSYYTNNIGGDNEYVVVEGIVQVALRGTPGTVEYYNSYSIVNNQYVALPYDATKHAIFSFKTAFVIIESGAEMPPVGPVVLTRLTGTLPFDPVVSTIIPSVTRMGLTLSVPSNAPMGVEAQCYIHMVTARI